MVLCDKTGRGERIRTSDLSVPNRAHYQAVLRPVSLLTASGRDILASARAKGQGTKEICGALKCARAMTYLVFHLSRQLAECPVKAVRKENRVVAESILTSRHCRDGSRALTT